MDLAPGADFLILILLKGHFTIYKKQFRVCKVEQCHVVWKIIIRDKFVFVHVINIPLQYRHVIVIFMMSL